METDYMLKLAGPDWMKSVGDWYTNKLTDEQKRLLLGGALGAGAGGLFLGARRAASKRDEDDKRKGGVIRAALGGALLGGGAGLAGAAVLGGGKTDAAPEGLASKARKATWNFAVDDFGNPDNARGWGPLTNWRGAGLGGVTGAALKGLTGRNYYQRLLRAANKLPPGAKQDAILKAISRYDAAMQHNTKGWMNSLFNSSDTLARLADAPKNGWRTALARKLKLDSGRWRVLNEPGRVSLDPALGTAGRGIQGTYKTQLSRIGQSHLPGLKPRRLGTLKHILAGMIGGTAVEGVTRNLVRGRTSSSNPLFTRTPQN